MSLSKNSSFQSAKYAQRRRRKIIGIFFLGAVALGLAGYSLRFLANATFFQIRDVEVYGAATASAGLIKDKVLTELSGSYFNFIPYSNIVFLPKASIEKKLDSEFIWFKNISLRRTGFSSLSVNVEERVPAALVCSGFQESDEETPIENDCYYADSQGYVFAKTSTSSSDTSSSSRPYLNKYYVQSDKGEIGTGIFFLEEKKFDELQKFLRGAIKGGLEPKGVLVGDVGDYEMYIKPDTTIYFDDRAPLEATLSNLLLFWQNALNKSKSASPPSFSYINLRFGNTIYYSEVQ